MLQRPVEPADIYGNVFSLANYFKWIFASGDQLISLIIDQTEQVYTPSRGGEGLVWGIHCQGPTPSQADQRPQHRTEPRRRG